jgi:hypothetical protein
MVENRPTPEWINENGEHLLPGIGMVKGGPPWESWAFGDHPRWLGTWGTLEAAQRAVEADGRRRGLLA